MNEINVGEGDKKAKPGLLLWRKGCVTGLVSSQIHVVWPVGYVPPWWGQIGRASCRERV